MVCLIWRLTTCTIFVQYNTILKMEGFGPIRGKLKSKNTPSKRKFQPYTRVYILVVLWNIHNDFINIVIPIFQQSDGFPPRQMHSPYWITNKKNPVKHNYLLHNHTLESVSSEKYFGITLQSDLKWIPHTNNIVANANKSLGFFKRNLEYACSVWDLRLHTAEHCNKIEMIQRRQLHLGMPVTDTIILAASQICYKLSPGLHYNNVDSKQNLLCFTRLFTIKLQFLQQY